MPTAPAAPSVKAMTLRAAAIGLALVWLLGPALLAAVLAWTPDARRWTSGVRPG